MRGIIGRSISKMLALATALGISGFAWGSVGEARAASPQQYRYHYVSLNAALPPGFERFIPVEITDNGRIYGNLLRDGCSSNFSCPTAGVYRSGRVRVISDELVLHAANEHGMLGGGVVIDDQNGFEQAALIERGKLKRLPKLKGEVSSYVHLLANSGVALVRSIKASATGFRQDYYYYCNGRTIPLPLLTNLNVAGMNNRGLIAGSREPQEPDDYRAFRFGPAAGLVFLQPTPPYASSRAFGIDHDGDVVGLETGSFASYPPKQRIGFWRGQRFLTYFVQGGATRFPELSNSLIANEHGLIVASPNFVFGTAFILPRPGLRIAVPEVTDEKVFQLWSATDVNKRGDIVGSAVAHDGGPIRLDDVLLQRVAGDRAHTGQVASSAPD